MHSTYAALRVGTTLARQALSRLNSGLKRWLVGSAFADCYCYQQCFAPPLVILQPPVGLVASQGLYFTHIKTTPQVRQDLYDINIVLH
jgi:hypothetical protein